MEEYILNPDLPLVAENYKGNLLKKGRFTNHPWPDTEAGFGKVLKWMFTPNPQKEEKKKDKFRLNVIRNNRIFTSIEDCIVWLGHSSFFIRLNGKNLLFDPVLRGLPALNRFSELPCREEDILNIDYLLLSHAHRDHFDKDSLEKIFSQNPHAKILSPLKVGKLVQRINKKMHVEEAAWYQQFRTEGVRITFLPALHWHRRHLNDFNKMLWGSFMIETASIKIFYAGDTAYGSHFKDIRNKLGEPDICLLPIGAYKPTFLMKQSHMDPYEAIQSFFDMNGKKFIPMHYGTFDLANEPLGEPIRILRKELDENYLKELAIGEKFLL